MQKGKDIFGVVPLRVVRDKRVGLNDLRVYAALSSFQGKKRNCFPSLKKLSERSGVHISHLPEHTKRLEAFGYIEKTRRGKRISNVYTLRNFPDNSECAESAGSEYAETAQSEYAEPANSNIKTTDKTTVKTPSIGGEEVIFGNKYFRFTKEDIEQLKKAYPSIKHFQPHIVTVSQILADKERKGEVVRSPVAYFHRYLQGEVERVKKRPVAPVRRAEMVGDQQRASMSSHPKPIGDILKTMLSGGRTLSNDEKSSGKKGTNQRP